MSRPHWSAAAALAVGLAGPAHALDLSSPAFGPGEAIPATHAFDGFGCTGDNVSPALTWRDAPEGTESFALMVHDPDAPTGGAGFWHWVVINIPASVDKLPRGAGTPGELPLDAPARQIRNDYGIEGWGGPCPPEADPAHRYTFTLYALPKAKLGVPADATASLAGFMINTSAIASTTLEGTYAR